MLQGLHKKFLDQALFCSIHIRHIKVLLIFSRKESQEQPFYRQNIPAIN